MFNVKVFNVGDGLSTVISSGLEKIQLDCGSQNKHYIPRSYMSMCENDPKFFILSHYHFDHYSGLFCGLDNPDSFCIEKVFLPVLPCFEKNQQFTQCLFAMNIRMLGGDSGSMDYDFLSIIKKLSACDVSYRNL